MCLICVDIQKDKLTSLEARNNLRETYKTMTKDHIYEVIKMIWKKEDEEALALIEDESRDIKEDSK
tara:strand:+ start:370 stop:567 length:198 start_codon:yes stop_codon:yes gene_type:complete